GPAEYGLYVRYGATHNSLPDGSTPQCAVRGLRLPEKSIEFWISVFRPAEGPGEPGTGKGPVAVGGAVRDAEEVGRGFEGHPGEVVELDQFRGGGVPGGQPVEGFVHGQNVLDRGGRGGEVVRQFDPSRLAAAFQAGLPPGALDQDAAHRLGGGGEEV